MLSVVFTILKLIGIFILVLLGVLLFVVCVVLFVPLRYRAEGFYRDTYKVKAKLSWLLHIVSFSLLYEKEQPLQMKLRILGIPVFDNLHEKQSKKKRGKTSSKKKNKKEEKKPEIVAASQETVKEDIPAIEIEEDTKVTNQTKERRNIFQTIKQIFQKIVSFFRNIKYTFQKICDTIKDMKNNITYYLELFKEPSTQTAITRCKKQLIRIFKNLKPQKFQLNLHIGMEDPATMGDILGLWGMLYPIHEGHIDIFPDFEHSVLEGEFFCKGRVTIYVYIWTIMIILFDKDIRYLRECLVREEK